MFGGPRFNGAKLKVNLKLSINRATMLQKKKENQGVMMKKEIAKLLEREKPELARIKTEQLIRDDFMIETLEIMEVYFNLLVSRFGLIEANKVCDPGIREAVCTIIWTTPYLASEIPEMKHLMNFLGGRYGKEFVQDAMENSSEHVSPRVIKKLQVTTPSSKLVETYLQAIAMSFKVPYVEPLEPLPDHLVDGGFGAEMFPDAPTGIITPGSNPGGPAGQGGGGGYGNPKFPAPGGAGGGYSPVPYAPVPGGYPAPGPAGGGGGGATFDALFPPPGAAAYGAAAYPPGQQPDLYPPEQPQQQPALYPPEQPTYPPQQEQPPPNAFPVETKQPTAPPAAAYPPDEKPAFQPEAPMPVPVPPASTPPAAPPNAAAYLEVEASPPRPSPGMPDPPGYSETDLPSVPSGDIPSPFPSGGGGLDAGPAPPAAAGADPIGDDFPMLPTAAAAAPVGPEGGIPEVLAEDPNANPSVGEESNVPDFDELLSRFHALKSEDDGTGGAN